jgi:hypothetical protein
VEEKERTHQDWTERTVAPRSIQHAFIIDAGKAGLGDPASFAKSSPEGIVVFSSKNKIQNVH